MENLNAEQIKKALECCTLGDCYPCPYGDIGAGCRDKMCGDALSLIKELAEENERLRAEKKEGNWKQAYNSFPKYVCTNCNHLFNNKSFKYCPNCGAKMDAKGDKDEK